MRPTINKIIKITIPTKLEPTGMTKSDEPMKITNELQMNYKWITWITNELHDLQMNYMIYKWITWFTNFN